VSDDHASSIPTVATAAVILAAGAGERLGGVAKALLPYRGASYLATIAAAAHSAGAVDVVVVVGGRFGREIAAHARQLGLRFRVNPTPERGMASSVALGFAAIANGPAAAAWLWPVDHPTVSGATLRRLIAAFGAALDPAAVGDASGASSGPVEFVQPRHAGRGGHPPLIARSLWPQLAACSDAPNGARDVLRAARRLAVEVDDPGVLIDVDTPADREGVT
jgi:molybdenum cofactor cytidylyltransferase